MTANTRSIRRLLKKLRSSGDRRVLFEAAILLPVVSLGLRTLGLPRLRRMLQRNSDSSRRSISEARHLAASVEAVARWSPLRYNCLQKSIVLWRMLQRRDLEVEVRFGVSTEGPGRQFHAWVEHDEEILNDDEDVAERFARFANRAAR